MNIKHKHAGHIIAIEGHLFTANDAGMWDLTDVWRSLNLPKGKQPGRWRGKTRDRMSQSQNLDVRNLGAGGHQVMATKRAVIEYAAWVSEEFEDMVFAAFEAVLEMPDVALLVADKMRSIGNTREAEALERQVFNERCDWNVFKALQGNTQQGLRNAVRHGNLTPQQAIELGLRPPTEKRGVSL